MAKQKQDPQIEWGFHAVIPRLVRTNYEKLTPVQKWLYVCLKDLCGEHGTCYRALRVLAEETGISTGMLSESIRCLHDAGLIHAEKKRRNNNPTAKEVWHITIVDIWQANAKEHPTKRSQNEHYKEENVHTVNNNVHVANDNSQERSPTEQQCSHSETEEVSLTSITIEAVSQSSNVVAISLQEDRNTPAAITDLQKWKEESGKHLAISVSDSRVDIGNDDEDLSLAETKPRIEKITLPEQKPDAGTRSLAADPPVGIQESASVQASSPGVGNTPARRSGASPTGISASPDVAQGGKRTRTSKKVTQAKPAIVLTAQEQAFWDLWRAVWFNLDIPPDLTETAYGHVKTLAPHITTQEQMNSLEKYARKRLMEQSNISRREVQLGNCVSSYQSWKQTQQKTQRDDGPALGGYYYIGSVG